TPQLLRPFFTTKGPGQGTDLALSITYSIEEPHDGRISVERPPACGAAFLVDPPPAPPPPAVPPAPLAAAEDAAGSKALEPSAPAVKRTILLVDDDPAVRRMVTALFGREGHTVEVARTPQHALDLVRPRTYDLILADARAPAPDHVLVGR